MPPAERLMTYREAAGLLGAYGIPLADARVVQHPAEAALAAQEIGFPVALKALSPDFSHKSDAGLVHLNLATAARVTEVAQTLLTQTANQAQEGLLVQAMVAGGAEIIVGLTTDPQFGPVIAAGSGGVFVELLDDVVLRLPPLSRAQASAMIREMRAYRLLQEYRHHPPADVPALAELLVNISRLAVEQADHLVSLDLNPVIVLPAGQGVRAVDVRAVTVGPALASEKGTA